MNIIESLYEIYYSQIYNYIFYRVMNKEITEDLVGEVFMKVISKFGRYDSKKSGLSTWIFTIAKNTLVDYYRSEKYRKLHYTVCEDSQNFSDMDFSESKDSHEDIFNALSKLNELDRTVIFLRYFSDLPYKKIAEHVGYTEKHIGVVLNRALKKFRTNYEKEGNGHVTKQIK